MAGAKRILTIDGGGIRGVFAAAIIDQMEKVSGKRASEIFDCFYGTSTGAILAAGLASGISARELKQFYLDKGAHIFEKLPWYRIVGRALYWTYSKEPLEAELRRVFGDKRIFDIGTLLSIQVKDTQTGTVMFFNNFAYTREKHPGRNLPLWQIIRASTAAPTFFEPEGNRYIDGGISSYNNPSYGAFIGAIKYLNWPAGTDNLKVFSVGTGYHPPVIPAGALDEKTKLHMAGYMIEELMDDINLLQNQIMQRLECDRQECWYRRYTIKFDERSFHLFGIPTENMDFNELARMDGVEYVRELARIGERVGERLVVATELTDHATG
jgi:hypothetical protein